MLIKKLESITLDQIPKKNPSLKQYFALSTNEKNAKTAFDADAIAGQLVAFQLNKQLQNSFSEEEFIQDILKHFQHKMNEPEHVSIIKEIYFCKDKIPPLTPLMYMAKPLKKLDTKTKKSLEIFKQLIQHHSIDLQNFESNLNFIEQDIFSLFKRNIIDHTYTDHTNSYIDFLDDIFTNDFLYLLSNQHYFQAQIDRFLKLYFFIYSAQLALNIHTNPLEKPSSQKLYFILNHEKASSERKNLMNYGYKTLISKVRYMFPYLSLLETLSDLLNDKTLKLYHFQELENTPENIQIIDNFTQLYKEAKGMPTTTLLQSTSIEEAIQTLLNTTVEQFKTDKKAVIDRFVLAFEKQISNPFFQSRGRSGKVLVLDQDTILLLTNLAIGDKKQLRFQELMDEFRKRSVYFDPKSEDALLELFERVGNVDRKSDSGDAVYVKTI